MDERQYASVLNEAVQKTLHCLDAALQGKDSQEGASAPFRLVREDMREVRAHVAAIVHVVAGAWLVPTPTAKVRVDS